MLGVGAAQNLMIIFGTGILIIVLSYILVQVHVQQRRLRDIERMMQLNEKRREKEMQDGKKSVL